MSDKRNTAVVIALILSLTIGARLLLWLEPGEPHWQGEALLMAERGMPIEEVYVFYTDSRAALSENAVDPRDSLCVVYPDEEPKFWPAGPRVTLVVVGSDAEHLSARQKDWLLGALASLNEASGQKLVLVHLATDSDVVQNPDLPRQAADLRELLVRKDIIATND